MRLLRGTKWWVNDGEYVENSFEDVLEVYYRCSVIEGVLGIRKKKKEKKTKSNSERAPKWPKQFQNGGKSLKVLDIQTVCSFQDGRF